MKALKKARLEDVAVVVGGIVPDADERRLKKLVAQGRISSTEAELLLQKARSARKGP